MKRIDDDFKTETEAHIAVETDQLVAEGLSARDARDLEGIPDCEWRECGDPKCLNSRWY